MNGRLGGFSGGAFICLLACSAIVRIAQAQSAGAVRTFIGCPVYRNSNSGPKSGCWLTTDNSSGILYDISRGRMKPQLGHEVLVEGRLGDSPASGIGSLKHTPCGGVVLSPVVVSPLARRCPAFMLPADGFPGRRFVLDPRDVLPPADVVEKLPPPPYVARTWHIQFTFDSDFLQYQYSEIILDQIGRYIRAGHPRRVEVIGYAVTRPQIISGRPMAEKPQLARKRAQMVALALRRLGATPAMLRVRWRFNPPPLARPAGLAAASRRRVAVRLSY